MGQVSTIGLDIAKNVFQTHGIDATGEVVVRRQFRAGRCTGCQGGKIVKLLGKRGIEWTRQRLYSTT